MNTRMKRKLQVGAAVLLALAVGITSWYKLYRDVPQPSWIIADPRDDFLYGSVGAEGTAGMPYWIWLVLPRICPDHLPGQGGYASLGRPWEEGKEMPAGFSKKTIGYVRVAASCALCHVASSAAGPDQVPAPLVTGPGHATDIQPLLSFFTQCAQDPHFNADEILSEIDMATKLSFLDRLLYRFVLIPLTQRALVDQSVLIDPELRNHSRHPGAQFSRQRMKDLADWLKKHTAK